MEEKILVWNGKDGEIWPGQSSLPINELTHGKAYKGRIIWKNWLGKKMPWVYLNAFYGGCPYTNMKVLKKYWTIKEDYMEFTLTDQQVGLIRDLLCELMKKQPDATPRRQTNGHSTYWQRR